MEPWGDALVRLAAGGGDPIVLAAPFVKADSMVRIFDAIPPGLRVTCVTRWKPEEIMAGVSDLEVWDLVKRRPNTQLRLRSDLHAKYYRFGASCLVGSANITAKALGWCPAPNLELLVLADPGKPELARLEDCLVRQSLLVDDTLYEQTKEAVAKLLETAPKPSISAADPAEEWVPYLEHPERLFNCYQGKAELVLASQLEDARKDLAALGVPPSLTRAQFRSFIRGKLLLLPVVTVIDGLARDGISAMEGQAIVDGLKLANGENGERTGREWEALKAWLLFFFLDRYRVKYGHHGPIFESGSVIGRSIRDVE